MAVFLGFCGFISLIVCGAALLSGIETSVFGVIIAGLAWLSALVSFAGVGICNRLDRLAEGKVPPVDGTAQG